MSSRMFCWFGRRARHMHRRHLMRLVQLEDRVTPDTAPHNLAVSNFYQNWNDASVISANDDWSGVPSVVGFLGDDTLGEGTDPQTILAPYSTIDVIASQGSNTTLTTGGVAEFDGLANPVIALQGDSTADAPNLVVYLNTTGRANITISYNLRDIDGTADNAVQSIALQYRIGNVGNFVNVPSGFASDVTAGPNLASTLTPFTTLLPSAVENQPLIQVRMITANAVGNDEWVGIDDIVVSSKDLAVNTHTSGYQGFPSVAVDSNGDTFVAWESLAQDGNSYGIYGQRFNAAGVKVGGEFQINTVTIGAQRYPSVAMDADGDAFVTWHTYGAGSVYGVYGQRFNSAGMKVGTEFKISTYAVSVQAQSAVAMDDDGDAFVTWQSYFQDGDHYGVYGQRFDAAGMKVGGEFQISTYVTGPQRSSSVAVDADGDAFVTWESLQDGSVLGIYGQRYNSAGLKVGGEFLVNTHTTGGQRNPSVAVDADGDAVVIWQSAFQDGDMYGIYGQRYNPAGGKAGGEFQVNTYTTNFQANPFVAMDADGDAIVMWHSNHQDGSSYGSYAQRYDAAGLKVGTEFQLNTYTVNHQRYPSVAVDADGDTFVTWMSYDQDLSSVGIFGQRFRSPNPVPSISKVQINDGSAQRSMVTSLQVTFDSKVTFAGSPAAAFSLVNQKTGNPATLSAAIDLTGTVVTLTFTGGSVNLGGSLADGRYTLTIVAGQFTGNGFDGNNDGISGDNYMLLGSPANGIFRFFGDADGDGTVAAGDFIQFRLALGGPSVIFDFDNDGAVAASDFIQYKLRFGGSI